MSIHQISPAQFDTELQILRGFCAENGADLIRQDGTFHRRTQHIDHIPCERLACLDIPCGTQTASLDDAGFLLVPGDELFAGAQRGFQPAGVDHHLFPALRVHGKFMIRTDPVVVIREMLLNDPCPQCYRTEDSRMTGRVVGKTEDQFRPDLMISLQNTQMDMD